MRIGRSPLSTGERAEDAVLVCDQPPRRAGFENELRRDQACHERLFYYTQLALRTAIVVVSSQAAETGR